MPAPSPPSPRQAARAGQTTHQRALQHALWTAVPILFVWLWCARERANEPPTASPRGLPHHRLVWYREHRSEFDMLWLGDSRTYCAMDPVVYDPLLRRRSMNMAVWAFWFPEQWAFFQDLLPEVPTGTVLCWSIGHQNFSRTPNMLGTQYPLGWLRAMRCLAFGYDWSNIRTNLYRHATALELPRRAEAWRDDIDRILAVPLGEPPAASPAIEDTPEVRSLRAQADELLTQIKADPTTLEANVVTDHGRPTSVEVVTTLGSYRRFEIDSAFFRRKQAEMVGSGGLVHAGLVGDQVFQPDPLLWATFERMLDMMAASGLKVIVNELEEAPHCYSSEQAKESVRRFMRDRVRPAVEVRGLAYVRADLDRLGDEDYFDYNHLNTRGVARFAPILAEVLRPHLRRD